MDLSKIEKLYSDNLEKYGIDSKSVGWNSPESQRMRFEKLMTVVNDPSTTPFSMNELGCGYGELFKYSEQHHYKLVKFNAYDISEEMIKAAKNYINSDKAVYYKESKIITKADYTVTSGIFNVKFEEQKNNWENYIKDTLKNMFENSNIGISFNLLTKYVDYEAENLYYADPVYFFDFCKKELSRYVNLIHDYKLYEWTIVVKKIVTSLWKKYGLIFKPNGTDHWQRTHAALPTPLHLKDDLYRIYFTTRDEHHKTYVGYFDADFKNVQEPKIVAGSSEPVLRPGELGYFDHHGVQCTSVVAHGKEIYMYYLGWTKGTPEPLFYTSIGLAISKDGGTTFKKYSEAPIMERSEFDPWMVSGGTVMLEEGKWRMWYISGLRFEFVNGVARSKYDIKYAESHNGIDWRRNGKVSFALKDNETNISRPTIIKEDKLYKAWYPFKRDGISYRIGYAESLDGIAWNRKDELAGIDVSKEGWDSQALDKQFVFKHKHHTIMLYNGNSFGYDGIGLAILTT